MSEETESLLRLEDVRKRAQELEAEKAQAVQGIRAGLVESAVLFVDVVGSTGFKRTHAETPEVWILWLHQLYELLAVAVLEARGRVVKYIGDEVMAVFGSPRDAASLIVRVAEIEVRLHQATGHETRLKVAVDFGKVFFLKLPGHEERDPQGSAVDRCARIGGLGEPGEVLASADFAGATPDLDWHSLGHADLKGLGLQEVFQLSRATVRIPVSHAVSETDGTQEGSSARSEVMNPAGASLGTIERHMVEPGSLKAFAETPPAFWVKDATIGFLQDGEKLAWIQVLVSVMCAPEDTEFEDRLTLCIMQPDGKDHLLTSATCEVKVKSLQPRRGPDEPSELVVRFYPRQPWREQVEPLVQRALAKEKLDVSLYWDCLVSLGNNLSRRRTAARSWGLMPERVHEQDS